MINYHQTSGRAVLSGFLAAICLLSGCAGALRLYDENKAKMSAGVREDYSQANVLGVIDVEKANLDHLLAEELKVVRDNHKLQVDFALLRIADDNKPMAETYNIKAVKRLRELVLSGESSWMQLRKYLHNEVDITAARIALEESAEIFESIAGWRPPACEGDPLPQTVTLSGTLDDTARRRAVFFYGQYREACDNLKQYETKIPPGEIRQAFEAWRSTKKEVEKLDQKVNNAEKEAIKRRQLYEQVKKQADEAKNSGAATAKELEVRAGSLEEAAKAAENVAKFVGGEDVANKRLHAIVVLLTAAAGGEIDTSDPKLKAAATVAKEIPSLAGDVKALLEQAQAPSVNNLLIEMRHQVLLLEYAKQLRTLTQQRVDILKTQHDALRKEAEYWLNFGDAICSYAIVSGTKKFPGRTCDNFSVSSEEKICKAGAEEVRNCILSKPWYETIQQPGDGPATREIYKALAAYLQALAIRATQHEQTFRLIDVRHHESLASRESALRGWDNLVAVPVNQIEAYYQAGLKPAEIADLIVKALGFTAIAVGVSQ